MGSNPPYGATHTHVYMHYAQLLHKLHKSRKDAVCDLPLYRFPKLKQNGKLGKGEGVISRITLASYFQNNLGRH